MKPAYLVLLALVSAAGVAQKASKPVPVPEAEPAESKTQAFVDKHYQVSFTVPRGWEVARKDYQVSTFHLDARSAPQKSQLRGLAMLDFNPFARSTLSGAIFYFSVEPKTTDVECAAQATIPSGGAAIDPAEFASTAPVSSKVETPQNHKDVQDVAGITFAHGHDEHGRVCIEARDEVYTAWHKHACYRFDLAINTFCPEGSGAEPISLEQVRAVDQRMVDILSTVTFGWEKSAPHPIAAPPLPAPEPAKKDAPTRVIPATAL
ncbi:hypothetical protein [Granulicella paludicola]|uniref:hypothetical protein n=1 Tax=Granulicella paludicola TaxID=474951 RepID=UPI0021E04ABA|nr:hypothetical protein [Granulicella paludicola]